MARAQHAGGCRAGHQPEDGTSLPIAQELKGRNTPFAVYSGLPLTRSIPIELQGAPWLEKPAPRDELTRTLSRLRRVDA
jgi:hypothetical protein